MLRTCNQLLKNVTSKALSVRTMTHYPIDDVMFGLDEDQIAVNIDYAKEFYLITN